MKNNDTCRNANDNDDYTNNDNNSNNINSKYTILIEEEFPEKGNDDNS